MHLQFKNSFFIYIHLGIVIYYSTPPSDVKIMLNSNLKMGPFLVVYLTSLTCKPGGRDCLIFSAFSLSWTTKVYKKREQRILNLVLLGFFLILTARASARRALFKKSLTSLISRGICNKLNANLVSHTYFFFIIHEFTLTLCYFFILRTRCWIVKNSTGKKWHEQKNWLSKSCQIKKK